MTLDLVLVGFGNVARRFVRLLIEQRAALGRESIDVRIVGVATKRHGQRYAARGLNGPALANQVERGGTIGPAPFASSSAFIRDAAKRSASAARDGRLVVVESTTLDVARGQPAIDHVRAALQERAHVVTANKGPIALGFHALARTADRVGRRFLFEGAVMDGLPIFNLVRETLPCVTITGFRGVVNSTTNYLLTAMEAGESFDAALSAMRRAGTAEANASFDVDGWDAAAKTAGLANVLLGARLTPAAVARQGVRGVTPARAARALRTGRRLKLVAHAEGRGRDVRARVALEALAASDPLAGLDGQQNALILRTDLLGEVAIVQRGSGLTATAYALLSDLVTIGRQRRPHLGRDVRRAPRRSPAHRSL